MVTTALRQRPQWLVLGTVVLAAAVGGVLRLTSVPEASPEISQPQETEQETPSPGAAALFESPMVSVSEELRNVSVPSGLVGSTSREDRLSGIDSGRLDPFAPVIQQTGNATSRQQSPSPTVTANAPTAELAPAPAVPVAPVSTAPDLPPVPVSVPAPQIPSLPSIPVANNPVPIPALPTDLPQATPVPQTPIEAVELSGVIQIGDRVGVIVREGQGQTSRHAFEGDILAGGQIRIKSIDLSAHEPLIILEYQGREYPRIVG